MAFYEQGRKKGDFESGIRMALQSVLVSPRFLFRLEQTPVADARQSARSRTDSPIRISRRACRSSCGAPLPTPS